MMLRLRTLLFALLALQLLALCTVSCSDGQAPPEKTATTTQPDEASDLRKEIGAIAGTPVGKTTAMQLTDLTFYVNTFRLATRIKLFADRADFLQFVASSGISPNTGLNAHITSVMMALDNLEFKYLSGTTVLVDPTDFNPIYDRTAGLYKELQQLDAQVASKVKDFQSILRDGEELLDMSRIAQSKLTGKPYDPANPATTDPANTAQLETDLKAEIRTANQLGDNGEVLTLVDTWVEYRAYAISKLRQLQERTAGVVKALRDSQVMLPNLGPMRPGYLIPADSKNGKSTYSEQTIDDTFTTSVVSGFAQCAFGSGRLDAFKKSVSDAYGAASATATMDAQLQSALGPEFFAMQPGKTVIVSEANAVAFRDTVSKAAINLLDVVVEARVDNSGNLTYSCDPTQPPADCSVIRYYVTVDVLKIILAARNAPALQKAVGDARNRMGTTAPGLGSPQTALMTLFLQPEMEDFRKNFETVVAPLKVIDDTIAASNVLSEKQVTEILQRKKDSALIDLRRSIREASDIINGYKNAYRTARETAGATGRFFDDIGEAFKVVPIALVAYIWRGGDDTAGDLAIAAIEDATPRFRTGKMVWNTKNLLFNANSCIAGLQAMDPTNANLNSQVDKCFVATRNAVSSAASPGLQQSFTDLVQTIEYRRAIGKTAVLVAFSIAITAATAGAGAPATAALLIGLGANAGFAVGINVIDGATGRPRDVVLKESLVDVAVVAVSAGLGYGFGRGLATLAGSFALTQRALLTTILGRSILNAAAGSATAMVVFAGLEATKGKYPWTYGPDEYAQLGWSVAFGGGLGFSMTLVAGLAGRSVAVRNANLDGPTLKKITKFVSATDLDAAIDTNAADQTMLTTLNARVNKYYKGNGWAFAFGDPELYAALQRLQSLATNISLARPPPSQLDFVNNSVAGKQQLEIMLALNRQQATGVKVPADATPEDLPLLMSRWRADFVDPAGPPDAETMIYVTVANRWTQAALVAIKAGDYQTALKLLADGTYWATQVSRGTGVSWNGLEAGQLRTTRDTHDVFGPAASPSIAQENFTRFQNLIAANGGQKTATLGEVQTTSSDFFQDQARTVSAKLDFGGGRVEEVTLRTVHVRSYRPTVNDAWVFKEVDVQYAKVQADGGKQTKLVLEYVTDVLLPKIKGGDANATNEAAYLVTGSVPFERGSSGIGRILQVIGLKLTGVPAKPFKVGYGVDLNAFAADNQATFESYMQGSVGP
jgi:hypothetical protein